jgi:hypothetical protein
MFRAAPADPSRELAFFTLYPGSMIVVTGKASKFGLVEIEYDGHVLSALASDIQRRCDRASARGI